MPTVEKIERGYRPRISDWRRWGRPGKMRTEYLGGRTRALFLLLEDRRRPWYLWLLEFLSAPW